MEFVILIGLLGVVMQAGCHVQGVAVQGQQTVQGQHVLAVQVKEIAENEARRIADTAIGIHQTAQNFIGNAHILAVFHGADPQADDFGTEFVDEFLRGNDIAHGLGHLAPVAVHHIAVREDGAVGRCLAGAFGHQQRAVEPAAMLVGAFQIEICREGEIGTGFQHGRPAGAGVKPDIENIAFALPVRAAAFGADKALGHNVFQRHLVPVVAARGVFGKALGEVPHPLGIVPGLAAIFAQQGHDGNAPLPLPGNAPVRARLDHIVDAFAPPRGNPAHLVVDGVQGALAQLVFFHADEPLGGGTEDHRILAAPAVRIGMGNGTRVQQGAHFLQLVDDAGIGFKDIEAGKKFHAGQKTARIVQGRIDVQFVFKAHFIVFATMTGGGVHAAGTGVQCHMAAENEGRLTVVEGVARHQPFQTAACGAGDFAHVAPAEGASAAFQQLGSQQILRAAGFHQHVVKFRMQTHGHIVRQGPRRGGPDDHVGAGGIGAGQAFLQAGVIKGKAHEDGRGAVIGVFYLGFGQGRVAGAAPVDGLLGPDDIALFHKIGQLAGRGGLVFRLHAHIGIVPVAKHAQALEFLALGIDPLGGVVAAAFAHHVGGQLLLLFLQFLLDLEFDGQAVAVPAGHVAGLVALHVAGLDDDILENLVEGRAHVNVSVGVGRSVVQHEGALVGIVLDHGAAGVNVFPVLEHLRLALGKIGLHGEGCLRQVQAFFIIAHDGSLITT